MKYVIVRKLNGEEIDRSPFPMSKFEAEMVMQEARAAKDGYEYELKSADVGESYRIK